MFDLVEHFSAENFGERRRGEFSASDGGRFNSAAVVTISSRYLQFDHLSDVLGDLLFDRSATYCRLRARNIVGNVDDE